MQRAAALLPFVLVVSACAEPSTEPPRLAVLVDGVIEGWMGESSIFYVVPSGGGVVLVDTGSDVSGAALAFALDERPVHAVLLTHSHTDHRGGAHTLGRVPTYVGREDVPRIRGDELHDGLVPGAADRVRDPVPPPLDLRPVDDGFELVVPIGEDRFTAVALPGHTPGSIAWLFRRVLFIGDAGLGYEGGIDTAPAVFSDDDAQARESLGRLHDLPFDIALDGHLGKTVGARGKLPDAEPAE